MKTCQLKGSTKKLKTIFIVRNTKKITQTFAKRLKKLCDMQIMFTTKKLKTCLPTMKSSFDKNLKLHMVYKITYKGSSSIYVAQTSRHVTNRFSEHHKKDSSVGQQLVECCGTAHNFESDILDACFGAKDLTKIETTYIKKPKLQLNTRDE